MYYRAVANWGLFQGQVDLRGSTPPLISHQKISRGGGLKPNTSTLNSGDLVQSKLILSMDHLLFWFESIITMVLILDGNSEYVGHA